MKVAGASLISDISCGACVDYLHNVLYMCIFFPLSILVGL